MTKLKTKLNIQHHWLNWCRLCANDDASNNVRDNDLYMRLISKCFDVEIGLEEPALGAMLCSDCYTLMNDLINFIENVNKVQPIFELLRHTEDSDHIDVLSLRQQYGLQTNFKIELTDVQMLSDDDKEDALVKRKRGRPRINKTTAENTCEEEQSINVEVLPLEVYEEGVEEDLVENHIWLEDVEQLEAQKVSNVVNRKRGRSPVTLKIEKLESTAPYEDLDVLSQNSATESVYEVKLELDKTKDLTNDSQNAVDTEATPIKRKRGRPRKNQIQMIEAVNLNDVTNASKCKNMALARLLLASPEPESHITEIDAEDEQSSSHTRRAVTCNICHKELSSESGLRQHNERVHMKRKPVVCDCCGKRVNNSSELKEHMLVHTDERPFSCPVCSASFKNKKRLNIHSQTHGMPKYECEICGKKLQTRAIWNKHKYVHSNERRFKCTICGTATKHSTALKVHLLSHTGFRPYACKYCNKAFASGANCRDHKMKKHPEEFAKDDDKSSRIQSVPTLDELRALAQGMEKGERLRKPRYSNNK
ncbi:zinc finger protein weckle-like isoform X1 [Drosophila sulfurigaster albostrigata]|uniref:zinc finger protein weckle-like isoform X1 n=2 Tax=Drosophila sulfurigaster albostrigata TaxID=89887 RepID=UPI002D21E326|nr:zinc finger protein weckle-like isoform X1 [Drosophila sulfurigaster albostrigata]